MKISNIGFVVCLLITSFAWSETPETHAKAINILNLTADDVQIWVSGVEAILPAISGYHVPCYPGETLEVQYQDELSNIACGEALEIDYER